jgi:hypothetical protein
MRALHTLIAATAAAMLLTACNLDRQPPLVFGTQRATANQEPAQARVQGQPQEQAPQPSMSMNEIAVAYLKLVLALGELDPGYVDAYYGPPAWADQAKAQHLDAAQIGEQAQQLIQRLLAAPPETDTADPELPALRQSYLKSQLSALSARAAMLQGHKFSFDDEALALYGVAAPHYSEDDFLPALKQLDALLPKEPGTLAQRYNRYVERYAVPKARLDSVMRAAIADARRQVRNHHLELPAGEHFELKLVGDKPWSAYNWYQGNFYSRIEVNAEQPVSISRAVQLASHEGYPGHHVYNCLLEKDLVRGLGWPEYQVYALYSPQSLIAEGSADFGVELSFPDRERRHLERELFDLAGFDRGDVETYDRVVRAARALDPAALEAARRYLDGRMDAESTVNWLQLYGLTSPERARQRVEFFDRYRSYIVNYSYGEALVRRYIAARSGDAAGSAAQWRAFSRLISTPRVPAGLQ